MALFCFGLGYFIAAHLKSKPIKTYCIAGIFFALSAYMRAQFDLSIRFYTLAVLCVVFFHYWRDRKLTKNFKEFVKALPSWLFATLILVGTYHAVTIPYRMYHKFSWIDIVFIYEQQWDKEEDLISKGGGFVINGGGTTACKVNPEQCKIFNDAKAKNEYVRVRSYVKALYLTLLTHPIAWVKYKAPYMGSYWFFNGKTRDDASLKEIMDNALLTVALLISLAFFVLNGYLGIMQAGTIASVMFFTFLATFMFHIELRYFDLIKFIGLYAFFSLIGQNMIIQKIMNRKN